jgi:hypothetical protein
VLSGDALFSARSTLDFQSSEGRADLLTLAPWNLALEPRGSSNGPAEPNGLLGSDLAGSVNALITGDRSAEFAWSLRGNESNRELQFVMRIPACPDTQCWFWLPRDSELLVEDVPVRERPALPGELAADSKVPSEPGRWWQVAAGGRSELKLRVVQGPPPSAGLQPLLLRGLTIEYLAQPQALAWKARLQLEWPDQTSQLPSLRLAIPDSARLSAFRVGNAEVPWQIDEDELGLHVVASRLPIDGPAGADRTITLEGLQPFQLGEPVELVVPRPENCRLIWTAPSVEMRVRLDPQLQVSQAALGDGWSNAAASTEVYRLLGETLQPSPRFVFVPATPVFDGQLALRIEWQESGLRARWEADLLDAATGRPLAVEVQPDWNVESIEFVASGRTVTAVPQATTDAASRLQLWPQPSDVRDGRLRVRVTGARAVTEDGGNFSMAAQWFLRAPEIRGEQVTALLLPSELSVAPTAVVANRRLGRDQADALGLIAPIPEQAVLFGGLPRGTPELQIVRQLNDLQADSLIIVDGQSRTLEEEIRVTIKPSGGPLDAIELQLAQDQPRPVQWRLESGADGGGTSPSLLAQPLPALSNDVQRWSLRFEPPARGPVTLTGRTALPSDPRTRIDRVFIPRASTHQAAVWLNGGQWQVGQTTGQVVRLPAPKSPIPQQRFEIAPDGSATITLEPANVSPPRAGWLYREQLDVAVDPTGWEWVESRHWAPAGQALEISAENGVSLLEAERDEVAVPLISVDFQDGLLRLPAADRPTHWRLVWRRPQAAKGLIWRWQPPQIETKGTVIERRVQLWLSPDVRALGWGIQDRDQSWLPVPYRSRAWAWDQAADSPGMRGIARGRPWRLVQLPPTEYPSGAWLARSVWLQGLLIAGAFAALGIGWWAAQHRWRLAIGLPFALTALAIWPSSPFWSLAVVALPMWWIGVLAGWVTPRRAPAPAHGLVIGTRAKPSVATAITAVFAIVTSCLSVAAQPPFPQRLRGMMTLDPNSSPSANGLATQAPDTPLASALERAEPMVPPSQFDVLIPVDGEGRLVGTRVYVPRGLFAWMERVTNQPLQPPRLLSAEYRLRLAESRDDGQMDDLRLQATWRLQIDDLTQAVRLPILNTAGRPAEVTVDGSPVTLRWTTAGPVWQPTRAGLALVEMSLRTAATRDPVSGRWQLPLELPPHPAAKLIVEYGSSSNDPRVDGTLGRVTYDALALQLKAALGPISRAVVTWQSRQRVAVQPIALRQASWFVSARQRSQSHELQIDFDRLTRADEVVEILLDRDDPPLILSPHWRAVGSMAQDGRRRRISFQSTRESAGPLRLLWTLDIGPKLLAIPPPRDASGQVPSTTLVALSLPERWTTRLNPDGIPENLTQPSASEFLRDWSGPAAPIHTTYAWSGDRPLRLELFGAPPVTTIAQTDQAWTIDREGVRVEYQARLRSRGQRSGPVTLNLPAGLEITNARFGSSNYPWQARSEADRRELILTPSDGRDEEVFTLQGWLPIRGEQPFRIPTIEIAGCDRLDQSIELRKFAGLHIESSELAPGLDVIAPDAWTLRGDLTVTLCRERTAVLPKSLGQFRCLQQTVDPHGRLVMALRPGEGAYAFRARLELFGEQRAGTLLTFDVPSNWAKQIAITGANSWKVSPAPLSGRLSVNVLLPSDRADGAVLELTGELAAASTGVVTAPEIRLRGAVDLQSPDLQRIVVLPTIFGGKRIAWETLGTQPLVIPDTAVDLVDPADEPLVLELLDAQVPLRMRPSDVLDAREEVLLAELEVYESSTAGLLLMSWDVIPGNQTTWRVLIPPPLRPLSASSQGFPVEARGGKDGVWEIPLAYGRLGQRIELAVQVPKSARSSIALPRPASAGPTTTILTFYRPADEPAAERQVLLDDAGWLTLTGDRALALRSGSAINATSHAADMLSQRPSADAIAWLQPWLNRVSLPIQESDDESAALSRRFQSALEKLVLDVPAASVAPRTSPAPSQPGWRDTGCYLRLGGQPATLAWKSSESTWKVPQSSRTAWLPVSLALLLAFAVWWSVDPAAWTPGELWIVAGLSCVPALPIPISAALMLGGGWMLVHAHQQARRSHQEEQLHYGVVGVERAAGTSSRASI